MPPLSQDAVTILFLQKSVLETLLSHARYQKAGTPQKMIKSIISIITTDHPKSYLIWETSIKEKQFLYALYQTVFHDTPELNQFLSTTGLEEKKRYGLKAAKELESYILSSASTPELSQALEKILQTLASNPGSGGPSTQW